jgi:ATP-dependent Clp protease ATP-binding subunit ClpC
MAKVQRVNICTTCEGSALLNGSACPACKGFGSVMSLGGKSYTLTRRMDSFGFALASVEHKVEMVTNLTAFGFGVLAAVMFIWHVISVPPEDLLTLEFWRAPSISVFSFWIAILLGCFTVYRGVRMSQKKTKLPEKSVAMDAAAQDFAEAKKPRDIGESFAPEADKLLKISHDIARSMHSGHVVPAHLFIAGFATQSVATLMWRLGITLDQVKPNIWKLVEPVRDDNATDSQFAPETRAVLFDAYLEALATKRGYVTGAEIVLAAMRADDGIRDVLFNAGVDAEQFENAAAWIRTNADLQVWRQKFVEAAASRPGGPMNRAMTSIATPLLDRYTEDLTMMAQAGQLPPLVGRDREVEQLLSIMESGRQSVILVGPNGSGRDAIVNGIAIRMVLEDVPKILADKRLLMLSIPKLVAGANGTDAEQLLLAALNEAGASGNIILVVPNIHLMSGSGSSGSIDLLATFAEELAKGYFVAIGTTTTEDYGKSVERSVLGTVMQKVRVLEMSVQEAIRVLEVKVGQFEYQFGTPFSYAALEAAVKLTDRYDHDALLPGKAIEVARETALNVSKTRGKDTIITADDVAAVVSRKTNIQVTQVGADESKKLLELESQIAKRVIGQKEAVASVSSALRRSRMELRSAKRPIGSFLFLGPTGVGKTELSKAVAEVYFGSEKNMIRLDMSEYQDAGSVNRMLGVPGSGQGGVLTEAVRKNPYTLLLCDELEKAHKDILNLFLQVMDDGRLTDATGRTVDFTNAIVIMTSNAGTQFLQDELGKKTPMEEIKKRLLETELKGTYRPEFLNRFDEVVVFRPLSLAEVTKIAELMVLDVANKLEDKGIYFETTETAIADLAKKGYDPLFGARPMRRMIQDTLENAIANLMLKGELRRGDKAVLEMNGEVVVEKKA